MKISVAATRSRNIKEIKTQQRVVLSNTERSQPHRPHRQVQRSVEVRCGGVKGRRSAKSKQAGGLGAVLLGKISLSTFHLQFKVVMVVIQEVSTERTQLKNNMNSKQKNNRGEQVGLMV